MKLTVPPLVLAVLLVVSWTVHDDPKPEVVTLATITEAPAAILPVVPDEPAVAPEPEPVVEAHAVEIVATVLEAPEPAPPYPPATFASAWVPALVYPQAAYQHPTEPGHYECWNEYGYPLPSDSPTCGPGWGGRPPENPTPIGTVYAPPPGTPPPSMRSDIPNSAWTPPLVGPQASKPLLMNGVVIPGAYQCWDQWGYTTNWTEPVCWPGTAGRPPENPVPTALTP